MSDVVVCILICGDQSYFHAGRQAALSVLQHTDFHLFLAHGAGHPLNMGRKSRVKQQALETLNTTRYRAQPFLLKFRALKACLEKNRQPFIILMDADAVVVKNLSAPMIQHALPKSGLGMVEQKTICGSRMKRSDFRAHYVRHSLAWLDPGAKPTDLSDFRYYNSGVVLGRRQEFHRVVSWALKKMEENPGDHRVGEHMIGDQDYFQFWTNSLHQEHRNTLPWFWNHCEHWDEGFPRKGAYIMHFSNFCQRPSYEQVLRMYLMRQGVGSLERICLPMAKRIFRLNHV